MRVNQNVYYLLAAFSLVLLTGITYRFALQNVFHFDDMQNITENRAIKIRSLSLDNLENAARYGHERRILPNISFALDWWRGDGSPRAFQWTNITIHCINVLLVFFLLATIIRQQGKITAGHIMAGAFAGAILWAVHPIQVQSVTYIVQRMNSMAALFILLSVLSYIRARTGASHPWAWFTCAGVAFLLGAITKEIAWITPFLILLVEYGICRPDTALISNLKDRVLLALPCVLIIYAVIDLATQTGSLSEFVLAGYANRDFTLTERLLTQPRVLVFYFSQLFWPLPHRFSIEHDITLSTGLLDPPSTLLSLLLTAVWCLAGIYALFTRRYRLIGFFLLWVPVTLVIESSIVALEMIFEHRMYLPSVGIAGLVMLLTVHILRQKLVYRYIWISCLVIAVSGLMLSTISRLPVWQSKLRLYQVAAQHAPNKARVWNNLGYYYMQEGELEAAEVAYDWAVRLDPDDARIWNNLGSYLAQTGNVAKAGAAFNRAISLNSEFAEAYRNRGIYYFEQVGDPDQAIRDLDHAIMLQPDLASAYLERGNIYYAGNKPAKALQDYNQALNIDPYYSLAYNNRGLVLVHLGKAGDAIEDFTRSLQLSPDYQPAYTNRGVAYMHQHLYEPALDDFARALELEPRDAIAHYNQAITLTALGQSAKAIESFRKSCKLGLIQGCRKINMPVP